MDSRKRGIPAGFGGGFKGLPVVQRIKVLFVARKLLKVQREKKELLEGEGEK
jgi:hypothetical protein